MLTSGELRALISQWNRLYNVLTFVHHDVTLREGPLMSRFAPN